MLELIRVNERQYCVKPQQYNRKAIVRERTDILMFSQQNHGLSTTQNACFGTKSSRITDGPKIVEKAQRRRSVFITVIKINRTPNPNVIRENDGRLANKDVYAFLLMGCFPCHPF